ncbi:permease-like cell division protein FtsX [Actinoplanes sp. NPDC023714]|uniref:permease-like cell division protein FtsX n=1 Tax=Actinoplanes sp. NPDC023714 TaxID=3154322 RepID=UPI0033F7E9A2
MSADPGADPGEMARVAMVEGGRIRQRRRMGVAGSAAAVVAVAMAVGFANTTVRDGGGGAKPTDLVAAAMRPPAPECSPDPVADGATDAVIYLSEPTDRELAEVGRELEGDSRVGALVFESRGDAYERFVALWADSPDFVAAVRPESLPVSYRLRLNDRDAFAGFSREYAEKPGVAQVVGRVCPAGAPVGGVL